MLWESDEPEHRALALPVEWQVCGAGEPLAIELHRLPPIEDRRDDIGREIGDT